MNKTYKFPALWMMCLMLFSCLTFTACDNGDDEDTNQYKGGISLNVFGPSPVSRGGVLRFLGSGMDKVTAVAIPGCDDITDIEVVSDTEIRVTVPQTAQPGLVVLKTPKGDITTKTELTFTEPIALEAFAPAEVKPGSELTITGDFDQKDQTWAQAQFNYGDWSGIAFSLFDTTMVPTDIYGWSFESRVMELTLAQEILDNIQAKQGDCEDQTNVGIIIQGSDLTFTKITIVN